MKRKNNIRFKRFLAYLVDMIIVTLISSLFVDIDFINPYLQKYESVYQNYTNFIYSMTDSMELLTSEALINFTYEVAYYGVITSLITLIVTILYFVVFQFFNKGKTIGKAIFKIKVVNNEGNRPTIFQFLLRSIIINSIFTSFLSCVLVIYLSKENYLTYSVYVEYLEMALLFISCGMIIIRNDSRGLHDLFAKTNVVFLDNINYCIKEEPLVKSNEEIKALEKENDNLNKKSKKTNGRRNSK